MKAPRWGDQPTNIVSFLLRCQLWTTKNNSIDLPKINFVTWQGWLAALELVLVTNKALFLLFQMCKQVKRFQMCKQVKRLTTDQGKPEECLSGRWQRVSIHKWISEALCGWWIPTALQISFAGGNHSDWWGLYAGDEDCLLWEDAVVKPTRKKCWIRSRRTREMPNPPQAVKGGVWLGFGEVFASNGSWGSRCAGPVYNHWTLVRLILSKSGGKSSSLAHCIGEDLQFCSGESLPQPNYPTKRKWWSHL